VLLKGLYFLTQTLLPLLADGGAIVNTTNNSALLSRLEPGYSAYASMKGGLIVLTRWRRSSAHAGSASTPSRPVHPHTDADNGFERYLEVIPAKRRSADLERRTTSAWRSRRCSPRRAARPVAGPRLGSSEAGPVPCQTNCPSTRELQPNR
jgi:NAD(P)-dependent dehydrogenase (short-subunit alcohol dehydrogenase family)